MDLAAFDRFCASLPATQMVVQWGGAHVWKVGGKVFAIASLWGPDRPDGSHKVSFKCSEIGREVLRDRPGVVPAPYLARGGWMQVQEADAMDDGELQGFIEASHAMIAAKLPRAKRAELGLGGSSGAERA